MDNRMYGIAKLDRQGGEHWASSLPEEYPVDMWVIRSTDFECGGLNLTRVRAIFFIAWHNERLAIQSAITCSKLTIEKLEQAIKYFQS